MGYYGNNYLIHHGVKGQKWGVRRWQNKDGSLTTRGYERYYGHKSGMSYYAGMSNKDYNAQYSRDFLREVVAIPNENGGLDWRYPEHSEIRKERTRQEYLDDPDSAFEKHMDRTNWQNGMEKGTTNNCTKVASSMILAKMGYDYDAGRCASGDTKAFTYWFDDANEYESGDLHSACSTIFDRTDNGSFGTVDLRNKNGGGHVFNWERNSKGEFNLYEGQPSKGEKFSGNSAEECFNKYLEKRPWFDGENTVRVFDMTDATPNWDHMLEDSVIRITKDMDGNDVTNSSYLKVKDSNYTNDFYRHF